MRNRVSTSAFLCVALLLAGCGGGGDVDEDKKPEVEKRPRNVILMIGDGMGTSQVTLGRLVGPGVHEGLALENSPFVGLVKTYPANALVTDSAASATAYSTGRKTTNGRIGMSADGAPMEVLGEWCGKQGMSVGLVTTTTITHATPACFAVHCEERRHEKEIAELYLGAGLDVAFGGGLKHFPESLQEQFRSRGHRFVRNRQEMMLCEEPGTIGLFSLMHMDFEIDRDHAMQPSLEEMTLKALLILNKNEKGFFLMVEGGRIDHACHGHDAATAAREVVAFDLAVRAALSFADRDGQTLVVVTADHATGGLAITESVSIDRLRGQKASAERMAQQLADGSRGMKDVLSAGLGGEADSKVLELIQSYRHIGAPEYELQNAIAHGLSERAGIQFMPLHVQATHLITKGHDGSDVSIYAWGPHAGDFTGVLDNAEVGLRLRRALERPK
jgi:alkaline phosphatase